MATLRDVVYGLAVGDALGVPYEFEDRGAFTCSGMVGFKTWNQPPGTFSDDTNMVLATCDSIRANEGKIDTADMLSRFRAWFDDGEYAIDFNRFDCGGTTKKAILSGVGRSGERDNGNGSLMRIAPLAFTEATDDEIRAVSAITHAHKTSTEACVTFVHVLREIVSGATIAGATSNVLIGERIFDPDIPVNEIRSGGYVLDTFNAALWCLCNTSTYADCVLTAVNLGKDTDTTACVAGALAGAAYGFDAIPTEWIETLRGKDIIERCLF